MNSIVETRLIVTCLLVLLGLSGSLFLGTSNNDNPKGREQRYAPLVFLVSIDAFRYDFLQRPECQTLLKLALQGGRFGPVIPQFPSFTFTNHYSMVTGLHPVSHGIVGNVFFDSETNETFSSRNSTNVKDITWWQAEPIWITAGNIGKRTGTLFWPGDQAHTGPLHKSKPYDKKMSNIERVDTIFQWLDKDPELSLVTLYFSSIDDAGHKYGPESLEMSKALQDIDRTISYLFCQLEARGLDKNTNIIITSDHGLLTAKPDANIEIERYLPQLQDLILWMDYNVVTSIFPKPNKTEEVFKLLDECIQHYKLPLKVVWSNQLKGNFAYHQSSRIGPITLIAEPGYCLARNGDGKTAGFHGYEPDIPDMLATIIGIGPSFIQKGEFKSPVSILSVYNLLARLMSVTPVPNNGTDEIIQLFL